MECLLGQIDLLPYGYPPMGYMLCNGAILQIVQNTALYSLIGTTFGGDGRTTFALPNLTGFSPVANSDYYIAVTGYYPIRP